MVRAAAAHGDRARADSSSPDRWRSRCCCSLRLVFSFERSGTCAPSIRIDGADVLLATVDPDSAGTAESLQRFHSECRSRPGFATRTLRKPRDAPLLRESHAYVDGCQSEADEAAEPSPDRWATFFETMAYQFDSDGIFTTGRVGSPRVSSSMRRSRADFAGAKSCWQLSRSGRAMQIVGVTADTKYRRLRDAFPTCVSAVRQGQTHAGPSAPYSTDVEHPGICLLNPEQVRALDQNLTVKSACSAILWRISYRSVAGDTLGFFGGLALLLTATGLYA